MILAITLAPTFDLTYKVDEIKIHEINTVSSKVLEPSGKGFNVAYNLTEQGHDATTISPIPESQLGHVWAYMAREKVKTLTSPTANEIRIHTSVVDSKEVTKFNEKSQRLTDIELEDLINSIENVAKSEKVSWIAVCGSVHVDNANALGLKLREICDKYGCNLAVDTSGASAEILYDFKPDFIKPNRDELKELIPSAGESEEAYKAAVVQLASKINGTVLCTDGSKVAYAANNEVLLEIVPPVIAGVNSVGAGDASLAGYIAAESSGSDFVTAISMAMTWASAACLNPGTAGLNMNAAKGAAASIQIIGGVSEISIQNKLLIGGSK
jgi:1-phosphofructokinase